MIMRCRFRCASKLEEDGDRWVIVLQPVYPRRLPLDAIPTGHVPAQRDAITPMGLLELRTSHPAMWKVGNLYEMTIRLASKTSARE